MDVETKPNKWEDDKEWSDHFIPRIKSILGFYLIGEPPAEEDQVRNTDLIVLKMDAVRIACRVRKPDSFRYKDEFTIRYSRPSGVKTELSKVIEGWGDYIFYGHGYIDEDDNYKLVAWGLGDLKVFRLWFVNYLVSNKGKLPGILRDNKDKSSKFYAYSWDSLPENFIVAQKGI